MRSGVFERLGAVESRCGRVTGVVTGGEDGLGRRGRSLCRRARDAFLDCPEKD
jgi:hypothetical protein